jgi:hypothetical protein
MSEEKKRSLNELLIPAVTAAAIAYFTGNKKTTKIAGVAKDLVARAIDDCTNSSSPKPDNSANLRKNNTAAKNRNKRNKRNKSNNANKNSQV